MKTMLSLLMVVMLYSMTPEKKEITKKESVKSTCTVTSIALNQVQYKNTGNRTMRFLVFNKNENVRSMLIPMNDFHLIPGGFINITYGPGITGYVNVVPDVSEPDFWGHDNRLQIGRFCTVQLGHIFSYNGATCFSN